MQLHFKRDDLNWGEQQQPRRSTTCPTPCSPLRGPHSPPPAHPPNDDRWREVEAAFFGAVLDANPDHDERTPWQPPRLAHQLRQRKIGTVVSIPACRALDGARRLRTTGIVEDHAEAIVTETSPSSREHVTKDDLDHALSRLKAEIGNRIMSAVVGGAGILAIAQVLIKVFDL
jgi:hypothetical protein